jgi:hypothetical protein
VRAAQDRPRKRLGTGFNCANGCFVLQMTSIGAFRHVIVRSSAWAIVMPATIAHAPISTRFIGNPSNPYPACV